MKARTMLIFAAALMAFPLVASAHHGMMGRECPRQGWEGHGQNESYPDLADKFRMKVQFLMTFRDEIGLSAEQIAAVKDQVFNVDRAEIQMNAKKQLAMVDLYQEMHKDNADRTKMKTKIDEKIEAKRNYSYAVLDALGSIHDLLSPAQKTKMKEIFMREKYPAPAAQS